MRGILLLTRTEINRLRRNRRYVIFTVGLPVVLYLLWARAGKSAYGINFSAYYMVAMATFGAFAGALNGNSIRISEERKVGWIRQLRLTPLPASAYVIAKVLTAMATTIVSIVIVMLLGRFYGSVHLAAWQWLVVAVIIWLGSTIFAALAVAVGYRYPPDQAQGMTMMLYLVFTILGGVWFPLTGTLGNVAKFTPTYDAIKISTDVIGNLSVPGYLIAGLFVWLVIFAGLATLSVRSMAESVLSAYRRGGGSYGGREQ
jgi:ABC-2 type transport system permease protein